MYVAYLPRDTYVVNLTVYQISPVRNIKHLLARFLLMFYCVGIYFVVQTADVKSVVVQ